MLMREYLALHVSLKQYTGDDELKVGPGDQVEPGQLSAQLDAAISLPASLFKQIDGLTNVGIFFAFYEMSTLFPVGGGFMNRFSLQRTVGSYILAATVGPGIDFQNLDEPVTIVLRLQIAQGSVSKMHGSFMRGESLLASYIEQWLCKVE